MGRCGGWLLQFGQDQRAATGERELLQLLYAPETHLVPRTPRHLSRVVLWNDRVLPVLDLDVLLGRNEPATQIKFLAIIGYQPRPDGRLQFGALSLAAPPVRIVVGDEQGCPLPHELGTWRECFCSCFAEDGCAIPVLDLSRLFSAHR